MCTNPISISRTNRASGKTFVDVVPCGKCEECRSKAHSDFAALAVLEARAASFMHFVTLTYDNEHVPLARVRKYYKCAGDEVISDVNESFDFVEDSAYRKVAIRQLKRCGNDMDSSSRALSPVSMLDAGKTFGVGRTELPFEFEDSAIYLTPSLRREDVRLWIKRCRVEYSRECGRSLDFRYVFFGEYGSSTFRPHYHGLLYGVSELDVRWMLSKWTFGFSDLRVIPAFNRDGSPARVKVANYVSKYIAKGCEHFPFVRDGLVERPRRFCSVGFGTKCLSDKQINDLKSFIDAKI